MKLHPGQGTGVGTLAAVSSAAAGFEDYLRLPGIITLTEKPQCYYHSDCDAYISRIENGPPTKIDKVRHGTVSELIAHVAASATQRHAQPELSDLVLKKISLLHNQTDARENRPPDKQQRVGIMQQENRTRLSDVPNPNPGRQGDPLSLGESASEQSLSQLIE
jgi:hypothetical protein